MTGNPSQELLRALNDQPNNEVIHVKDVTDVIGKYGPWQRLIFILTVLRGIPTAFHNFGITFFAPQFDVWCARPADAFQNWTAEEWKNICIPFGVHDDGTVHYSRCLMYEIIANEVITINKNKTVACDKWEYDNSFYSSTIVEEYDLVCENDWLISFAQSVYMGGMMFGVLISGHLADRFGRQPVLNISVTLMLLAGIIAAFSPNYTFFCAARFFLALGVAGTQNTSFCLLMEILGPEYRTRVTFAFSFGWVFGLLLLPGMAYLIRDWMYLQLVSALAGSILLCYWCFMPESPRWLVTQGKYEEAEKVIQCAIKRNKIEICNMPLVMRDLKHRVEKETRKKNPSIFHLFKTSVLCKNTIFIYLCYLFTAFVFYGLSLAQTNLGGDPFINFFIGSAVEIPAYILCLVFIRYLRRRVSFMIFSVIGGISCFFIIASSNDFLWIRLTAAMIGKLCVSGAFIILAIHAAEIFPTVVRTVGSGSSLMMGRIGAMTAPFIKELGSATHEAVPPIVFGSLSLISACFVLLLPETFNQNLPDTIFEAESLGKKPESVLCTLTEEYQAEEKDIVPLKAVENGI